jgi:bifunctional UDP-N-acetylglucosamine pyrophosphorylase/glucosamine-1-phosphate N-acetyltransferase
MKVRVILLAAGKGTRMRSRLPKLLHHLSGRPMILHSLESAERVTKQLPVIVVGHGSEAVRETVGRRADFVEQVEQLGTGHAVLQAHSLLKHSTDLVVVTNADLPLITSETLKKLIAKQEKNTGPFTMLVLKQREARGFGRVKRNISDQPFAIVEEAEASAADLDIDELNVGAYCFQADWLWPALKKIKPSAKKKEYYLTDLLEIAASEGGHVETAVLEDPIEAIGINTREHLAEAEAALRKRINQHWMLEGVTLLDPQSTFIDSGVTIGQDTVVWPNTMLLGTTAIGEDCIVGPNTVIRSSRVGNACRIEAAVVELAVIENNVDVGPFAHLRKGAQLGDGVHMGNFGEIKNSTLAPGVKMGHFSYIGDATIGPNVNIGAGTITANYDGEKKNPTVIESDVFIGSDTMLVAPLHIGKGARTGAGSVVTKDVPAYTVVVGVPARAIRKLEEPD